ncbi:MAG TPA: tRNA (adenosine(37)-N6)-dimethylallyltransferase MiaA [Bacteroidales bacterium]|nr:tRNA (adenosine(37)-N6)-dimethylallyltransferase MiaA [Bacteroidales bacterium]
MSASPLLIVLGGPTASGKTELAIRLAQHYRTEIVSADSRQFYREMKIGTAAPAAQQLRQVPHHFVGHLSIHEPYDVATYERDALSKLQELFDHNRVVVLTGGSGLFLDAVSMGLDNIPEVENHVRQRVGQMLMEQGIKALQAELERVDPAYFSEVDKQNPRRLQRALEVYYQTGRPFSYFRQRQTLPRPFAYIRFTLRPERIDLINRINLRVERMMEEGLLDEVRKLYSYRHLNALNTVGYKELFEYLDGKVTLEAAVNNIKVHTRQYAKRQLTWFRRNKDNHWLDQADLSTITGIIREKYQI